MDDGLYLGIDFGTATNYVTKWNSNKENVEEVEVVRRHDSASNFFDNIIYYESLTNEIIGENALNRGIVDPLNMISSVKRRLEEDNWKQYIPAIDKEVTAHDVTRDIFRIIRKKVEDQHAGKPVQGAVISVPFAFQHNERQKIKKAAQASGLNVMSLIEEPVAAAICFGLFDNVIKNNTNEKVLIFDLGGGTFDVTIFEMVKETDKKIRVEVLNTDGHKNLGGNDIDNMLVEKFQDELDYRLADIANEKQRKNDQLKLMKEAKKVKELLSDYEFEDAFCADLSNNRLLEMEVEREQFNQWLEANGFLADIRGVIENSLYDIDLAPSDIDRIVLAGGSSNIPLINKEIEKIFGQKAESIKNPGELVGEGAGIYCGSLLDKSLEYEIIPKVSHAIGIGISGNRFEKLIEKNAKYETFSSRKEYKINNRKDKMKVPVYQGNSTDLRMCSFVGNIIIDGTKFSGNRLGVKLGTDENGIVKYKLYDGNSVLFEEGEVSE